MTTELQCPEDNLQKAAYKLDQTLAEHGLTIYVQTTNLMTFKERDPVSSKIITGNKIIEQVNSFNYLGNLISYDKKVDIDKKLSNYLKITGIINSLFRPHKTLTKTRIKL